MTVLIKDKNSSQKYSQEKKSSEETAFARWYKNHKDSFNQKRRNRYQTDPEYKQRMIDAAKKTRQAKKKTTIPRPPHYTITQLQAAEELGVTIWTLQNWRRKSYFPAPFSDNEGVWFTENQIELLEILQNYYVQQSIKRLTEHQKNDIEQIAQHIHANWNG